jgi:hypothetical protein
MPYLERQADDGKLLDVVVTRRVHHQVALVAARTRAGHTQTAGSEGFSALTVRILDLRVILQCIPTDTDTNNDPVRVEVPHCLTARGSSQHLLGTAADAPGRIPSPAPGCFSRYFPFPFQNPGAPQSVRCPDDPWRAGHAVMACQTYPNLWGPPDFPSITGAPPHPVQE